MKGMSKKAIIIAVIFLVLVIAGFLMTGMDFPSYLDQ